VQWTTLIVSIIVAVAAGGLLGASAIAAIHHGQTVMHDELDSL